MLLEIVLVLNQTYYDEWKQAEKASCDAFIWFMFVFYISHFYTNYSYLSAAKKMFLNLCNILTECDYGCCIFPFRDSKTKL